MLIGLLLAAGCAMAQGGGPSDPRATRETVNLCRHLLQLEKKGFLFGHQDDLAYGVNWRYKEGGSDVKEVTGDYPGLYGWELGGLEKDDTNNIDGVPFKKMKQFIREGYERGGVITISWHANNPQTGGNAWDTTQGTVSSILPGGDKHALYEGWLDKLADFLLSLKGNKGEYIPVLFRPYHELTGNWFWWCRNNCSPGQFKAMWQFMVHYLRDVKKVHNVLYVYNTADFSTAGQYLERYPGDSLADVLSFDAYQYGDPQKSDGFVKNTGFHLSVLDSLGAVKHKITALAETGYEQVPYADWWTETLLKAIGGHPVAYVLVWRNHGYNTTMKHMHYYAPYKGQVSEQDFIKFYRLDKTFFEKDAAKEGMYR